MILSLVKKHSIVSDIYLTASLTPVDHVSTLYWAEQYLLLVFSPENYFPSWTSELEEGRKKLLCNIFMIVYPFLLHVQGRRRRWSMQWLLIGSLSAEFGQHWTKRHYVWESFQEMIAAYLYSSTCLLVAKHWPDSPTSCSLVGWSNSFAAMPSWGHNIHSPMMTI